MKKTDDQFRDLMKSYQPDKAPGDFTLNVMNRIYAESKSISEYKPVLNKWFLRAIYTVIGVFLGYAMFYSGASDSSVGERLRGLLPKLDFSQASGTGEKMVSFLNTLPQLYVVIFLSATFLLLLDQLFLKRKKFR